MTINLLTESMVISDEVLVAKNPTITVSHKTIADLLALSNNNTRKRMRLCAHKYPDDPVHEMFIVLQRGNYIRPHKHLDKAESLLLLSGKADLITFDDQGRATGRMALGPFGSGSGGFYHKMGKAVYHTLIIKSEYIAFLEIAKGPFKPEKTVFARWAPREGEAKKIRLFYEQIDTTGYCHE